MNGTEHGQTKAIVAVVDDDRDIREALQSLLEAHGFDVEIYSSALDLAARVDAAPVDCLILDFELPGASGLDIQAAPPPELRDVPIVFVTGHADVATSVRAMKAGATDLLTKPFIEEELLAAVHRAVSRARSARLGRDHLEALRRRYARLTPRERQVMALVVQGLPNKVAADVLGVTEITIKVQRSRIMKKMEAPSLPDLVRMADLLARGEEADGMTRGEEE